MFMTSMFAPAFCARINAPRQQYTLFHRTASHLFPIGNDTDAISCLILFKMKLAQPFFSVQNELYKMHRSCYFAAKHATGTRQKIHFQNQRKRKPHNKQL